MRGSKMIPKSIDFVFFLRALRDHRRRALMKVFLQMRIRALELQHWDEKNNKSNVLKMIKSINKNQNTK
jgi:hypothetical protein